MHSLIKFVIAIEPCIIQQVVKHFSSKRFRYKLGIFFKRYSPPPPASAYYFAISTDNGYVNMCLIDMCACMHIWITYAMCYLSCL